MIKSMEDYKTKATNPQQYDSPELDWRIDGDTNSPSRIFFRENLKRHLENLSGKTVLDIGSGVGHLFNTLKEFGAKEIYGLEPAKRNVETSKELYPDIPVFHGSLEEYRTDKKFDVVVCIMVFEHILDIKKAFTGIAELLKEGGTFYFIVGDMDFHIQSKPEAEVDVQKLSEGTFATKTIRPNGTMYDIFRPLDLYVSAAKEAGLDLVDKFEMVSTSERHKFFGNKPICHLMIFKKQ